MVLSFFQARAPRSPLLLSCYSPQTKEFYAPTLLSTQDVPLVDSRSLLPHHILFHLALFDNLLSAHKIKIDFPNNLKPVHSHYWAHYHKGLLQSLTPNQVHPVPHLPTVLDHSSPSQQLVLLD